MQAILTQLLLSNVDAVGEETIIKRWDTGPLSEKEIQAMLLVYRTLRPFVPSTGNTAPISAKLPLVILANSILHSAGYGKFKQHICPEVKPGAVHSFPIDSVAIYQMFGPVETGSRRIKSINDALGNKRQVFQSIFNLDRINVFIYVCSAASCRSSGNMCRNEEYVGEATKKCCVNVNGNSLCTQHGLSFRDRITYDPLGIAVITESCLPEKRRPVSTYEERKKLPSEETHRPTYTQSMLEKVISYCEARIKSLESRIRSSQKNAKTLKSKVVETVYPCGSRKQASAYRNSQGCQNSIQRCAHSLSIG
ncbi:uncharacterized protein BYT42DRAFT_378064 [Radiomyces spectabilis]|uniref:uncharacterized protein n=1 Tax=Radiomyces spectabilis TaxID=64574 RepID=UPI00221EEDE7|nr:uncharacterized protein BYT42DRAFT_378064 [Radiomyces spectabilis]KAI8376197.1 hypothetical protein BYT42DRAFT_378064 [Radiomyces spectabilis]